MTRVKPTQERHPFPRWAALHLWPTRRRAQVAMLRLLVPLLLCGAALGQQPDAVKSSGPATAPAANSPLRRDDLPEAPQPVRGDPPKKNIPVTGYHDTRLKFAIAFSWSATTADVVTTLKGFDSGRCHEVNPLFGPHPSAARVAGISYGYTAGYTLLSLWLHSKDPEAKAPWIGNLLLGGGNTLAAGLNTRCF